MSEVTERDRTSHDLGVAFFFLIWAGVGWVSLLTNADLFSDLFDGGDPGPALMPVIVLGILTIGGIASAVPPTFALTTGRGVLRFGFSPNWKTIACFASVVAFPAVMEAIGYVPTTLVFVFIWAGLLSPNIRQHPLRVAAGAAITAIATTLVIYLGFDLIIDAQLP